MRTISNSSFLVIFVAALNACSGSSSNSSGSTGGVTAAGASTSGGSSAIGGGTSQGGATNTAPGTGGSSSTGGSSVAGGTSNAGGATNTGGTKATSAATNAGGSSTVGGTSATGGSPTTAGSKAVGGTATTGGSKSAGGTTATGGTASTGGSKAVGGTATTGGSKASGGATATGGATAPGGATATGGSKATGGTSGNCPAPNPNLFAIGADITDQEVAPVATRDNLLTIMKSHGFNYVRLRTFVDPKASDGYDKQNGYDDITHTVDFGKQIKDACMGLMVDFHYSDNWADPGKQCVPVAWQGYTNITDLAKAVYDYTKDSITKLIAGGARPEIVQIGNETTPGMLLHRCDSGGQPTGNNPVTGSISSWANLGALLKAGAQAVKDVDPSILTSLHIDRGDELSTSKSYITNAQNQGVKFDAFGESCYTAYQGQPSAWQATFAGLASSFPSLKLFIAEYGPEQRAANDIIFNLANNQGFGTFNWEPTTQGAWNATGHDLLRRSGTTYTAQPDLALYDAMMTAYASRL
jgi:arabinogalactan endo-1,4-beta-galactosidase